MRDVRKSIESTSTRPAAQQDVPMEIEPLIEGPSLEMTVEEESLIVLQAENSSPSTPQDVIFSSNLSAEVLPPTNFEAKYKAKLAECKNLRRKVKRLKDRLTKAKRVIFNMISPAPITDFQSTIETVLRACSNQSFKIIGTKEEAFLFVLR